MMDGNWLERLNLVDLKVARKAGKKKQEFLRYTSHTHTHTPK